MSSPGDKVVHTVGGISVVFKLRCLAGRYRWVTDASNLKAPSERAGGETVVDNPLRNLVPSQASTNQAACPSRSGSLHPGGGVYRHGVQTPTPPKSGNRQRPATSSVRGALMRLSPASRSPPKSAPSQLSAPSQFSAPISLLPTSTYPIRGGGLVRRPYTAISGPWTSPKRPMGSARVIEGKVGGGQRRPQSSGPRRIKFEGIEEEEAPAGRGAGDMYIQCCVCMAAYPMRGAPGRKVTCTLCGGGFRAEARTLKTWERLEGYPEGNALAWK